MPGGKARKDGGTRGAHQTTGTRTAGGVRCAASLRKRRFGRISRAWLAVSILATLGCGMAAAQSTGGRPSGLGAGEALGARHELSAPAVVLGAPASEAILGIKLASGGPLPPNSYVRIRGLLPQMALTEGHSIAPGAWAVPLSALADLKVVIPAGVSGRAEVAISLIAIDGGLISETRTSLIVSGGAATPQPKRAEPPAPSGRSGGGETANAAVAPALTLPPPPRAATPPPATPGLSGADRERAEKFLARGMTLLEGGDIASARLFFRRAADAGLAEAAMALGGTFDPNEFGRIKAVGLKADPAEARIWYERARVLGASDAAAQRLQRLGGR